MKPPFDVFISHNRQDQACVLEIHRALQARGLRPWLDQEELIPGRSWQEAIEKILVSISAAIVLVGKDGLGPWELPEMRVCLSQFVKRKLPVIPVLLPGAPSEPELPLFLGELTWVDLRNGITKQGIDQLIYGITGNKVTPALHDESLDKSFRRSPQALERRLGEALEDAFHRREKLAIDGADTRPVDLEILELQRQMREGGRLQEGDILAGRFRLIKPLGRGGFATVWKASDTRARRFVAAKVLHGQFCEDRTRLDRFFRGARKMSELQHQGIVKVLERRLHDGGYHFFVMEYVPAGDLRQSVLERRLGPERILPLIGQIAEALHFAHGKGLVHRDVKPANILLDTEGRPKLSDFDLVRAFDTSGGTLGGGMMGTFLYTAPEVMREPQEAGVPADVYALAMTTAFCFFGGDLPVDVLRDSSTFFRRLPCPAGVRAALERAAAWDPTKRFASIAEFARAIQEGETSMPESALTVEIQGFDLENAKECLACGTLFPSYTVFCGSCSRPLGTALVPYVLPGRFRFERRMGMGGMGVVYRGVDVTLGRPVAVKTLRRVSPEDAMRLRREARTAAGFSHAHLAAIHAMETWQGMPLLFFELMEGGTLAQRIERGPLDQRETVELGIAMARALEHLHGADILHRDIKPSNIGFTRDGTAKLFDFGIAHPRLDLRQGRGLDREDAEFPPTRGSAVAWEETPMSETASRQLIGTLSYLSPEALDGQAPNVSFDLWALAMVLYECVLGRKIFSSADVKNTMARIRIARIPDFEGACPWGDPALGEFFRNALHRTISRRPQTAHEMRRRLEQVWL